MQTAPTSPFNMFGVFELNAAGEILYSRLQENGHLDYIKESIVGRNFFEEFGEYKNCADFRLGFKNFIRSRQSVESLHFDCSDDMETMTARILMTRGHETDDMRPSGFVILDIRKSPSNGAFMGE